MKNWKKVKLGTLLTESKVLSEKPNTDRRIRVKLNVLGVEKRPIIKDKKGATKYYLRKAGQFVYGKQNLHKGAFGIIPDDLDGFESSLDIPAFDVDESCYPEWIFYFFKKGNFYLKLDNIAKGVGSKRIHPKQISELDIFLPSKEEQRKVLDEIEKAEINNKELVKEIDSQEENLAKLRQSILQDAIKGELTKAWREQNPSLEPACDLLTRIKNEKEKLIKEKKIGKEKIFSPIKKEEVSFQVPVSWEWSRLQTIFKDLRYGTSKKCDYNLGDNPVLRIPNINQGQIVLEDLKSTNLSDKEIENLSLEKDDILIIRSNGSENLVGRSAVIQNLGVGYSFAGYLIRLKIFEEINSLYIHLVLESKMIRSAIEVPLRTTSGVKNINSTEISKLIIPVPPITEQKVIVQKVYQSFAKCDTLEKEINKSKTNAEKLMQSVLSELLGDENNVLIKKTTSKKETKKASREIQYNSKTLLMDLVKLLNENGKLHAEDLWKMSKHTNDIDAFYAELKEQIEEKKTIKESEEKGYLELV